MPRKTYRICVLAGDGIGPEVTDCGKRVLSSLERAGGPAFAFEAQDAGHGAFEKSGSALSPDVIAAAKAADAVLVGAMDVARLPAGEPEPLTALRRAPRCPRLDPAGPRLSRRAARCARRSTSWSCARSPRASIPASNMRPDRMPPVPCA